MEIDEALTILSEISCGDTEREAFQCVKDTILGLLSENDAYRALYEGAMKRIERFRDIASKPDLPDNVMYQPPKHSATDSVK